MTKTFLTVTFQQKDRAKASGARWDRDAGQWYVPAGVALTAFGEWLPTSSLAQQAIAAIPTSKLASPAKRGTARKAVKLRLWFAIAEVRK